MSEPFSLLPYTLAASGRAIDGIAMNTLVAAGLTLLQRSAPLVRALTSSRPALLLPESAASLTALAACDGHVALMLDFTTPGPDLAHQLKSAQIGVVFTLEALVRHLPPEMAEDMVLVLLDKSPAHARVRISDNERTVDLGSHVGLSLEGRSNVPLSDDPVVSWYVDGTEVTVSHAQTLSGDGPLSWLAAVE